MPGALASLCSLVQPKTPAANKTSTAAPAATIGFRRPLGFAAASGMGTAGGGAGAADCPSTLLSGVSPIHKSSESASSVASCNRSSGSIARHFMTISLSSCGTLGAMLIGGSGGP
jgi:hypothetical protein